MRRLPWVAAFVFTGFAVFAQDSVGYLAIMPGSTLNTSTQTLYRSSWFTREREFDTGFIASVEGGFSLNQYLGLHFAYIGAKENFTEKGFYYGTLWSKSHGSLPLNILELGPEVRWRLSADSQVFFQVNLGHTLSSGTATYDSGGSTYHSGEDDWALGLAAGFRCFPSKAIGVCVQVTYHRVNDWPVSSIWVVQTGLVFRF